MRRRLKGYRTVIFNAAAGLVAVALALAETLLPIFTQLLGLPELQAVLPDGWLPWVLLVVALGNIALRRITDTPMGRDAP